MSKRRVVIAALILAACAWIAGAALTLAAAARDASAGVEAIEAARALDPDEPKDLVPPLVEARAAFVAARNRTRGVLVSPARILPWLGRQIRALDGLAAAAAAVTEAGLDAATDADAVLARDLGTGRARVAGLRDLAGIAGRARDRLAAVDPGPGKDLVGLIAERHERLVDEIAQAHTTLDTAAAAMTTLADLLEGPRTILLVGANTAEMRAGSGMFLTVGVLRTRAGHLELGETRSVTDVQPPPGRVRATGDYQDRWGWLTPADDWRNLMLSPRFDVSAPMAARMWRLATGRSVDAVIALSPVAIEALVEVTGPVRVDGRRLTAGTVLDELLLEQYERFQDALDERREAHGRIAQAVFDALNARDIDPRALFDALADAVRGRHLMAWSAQAGERETFARAGIDGALDPDSMLVSLLNRGGNKLDPFIQIEARLSITPDDDGAAGLLEITITNDAPGGLPRYVAGPSAEHGTTRAGEYLGFLAVTLPGFSGSASIEGVSRTVALGADGPTRVVAGEIRLARGRTRVVRVPFRLASAAGTMTVEPGAREPATQWFYADQDWSDRRQRTIRW